MEANIHSLLRERPRRPRRSILLIEDDPASGPVWRVIVKKLRMDVFFSWVNNADSAEKTMWLGDESERPFDIIISDIFLGKTTGIDLWRKCSPGATTFIFTSAISQEEFNQMFRPGETPPLFIRKPVDLGACLKTLDDILFARQDQSFQQIL